MHTLPPRLQKTRLHAWVLTGGLLPHAMLKVDLVLLAGCSRTLTLMSSSVVEEPPAVEFRARHRLDTAAAARDAVPGVRCLQHGGEGQRHHELHELMATSAGAAAP
jgi:hypothetical protein